VSVTTLSPNVDGKKRQVAIDTRASREKSRGADPELSPGLRWTLDRMVVTEGVPVNLTLQLEEEKIDQ
jgi:hypothetical protein